MITKSLSLSEDLVGSSEIIQNIKERILRIALTDLTVLLLGESGTGKSLIARKIHESSQRCGREFVEINMAAIPESLAESELFGTVSGAYTNARNSEGFVSVANGGTLFFDEIAELPLAVQAKLLHFVETGNFCKVGSTVVHHVDVRIICATNADLQKLIKEGKFNEALYYRIKQAVVNLPPLRQRKEDIIELTKRFLKKKGYDIKYFTKETLEALVNEDWPGNIRQLYSCLHVTCELYKNELILPEFLTF